MRERSVSVLEKPQSTPFQSEQLYGTQPVHTAQPNQEPKQDLGLIPLSEDTTRISLAMLQPHALQNGAIDALGAEYFGIGRLWLAGYVNAAHSEAVQKREDKLRAAAIKKYGPDGLAGFEQQRKAELTKREQQASIRVNRRFMNKVQTNFDIQDETPMKFADRHFANASDTYNTVYERLNPGNLSPLRNEAQLKIISPAEVVKTIASENTNDTLRSHTIKRLLFAHISGSIEAQGKTEDAGIKLAQLQAMLDKHLYAGETGSAQEQTFKVLFDEMTNTARFVDGVDGDIEGLEIPEGWNIKQISFPLRSVQDSNLKIFTHINEKNMPAGVEKAVKKAVYRKEKDDTIRPEEDVKDTNRMIIVVMGNQDAVDDMTVRIDKLIRTHQDELAPLDENLMPIPSTEKVEITPDHETNGHKDQAGVKFNRLQVQFPGLPNAIEVQIQTLQDYLRSRYQVGMYNDTEEKYTGKAHPLYEGYRSITAAPYILNGNFDREKATQTMHEVARDLSEVNEDAITDKAR